MNKLNLQMYPRYNHLQKKFSPFLNYHEEVKTYDYGHLNAQFNGEKEVRTDQIIVPPTPFEYNKNKGISGNLKGAFIKAGVKELEAEAAMYETLQALEDHLKKDPQLPPLDRLEDFLKSTGVQGFEMKEGILSFYAENSSATVLRLEVLSERQKALKEEVQKKLNTLRTHTETAKQTKELRKEIARLALKQSRQDAEKTDDSQAVHITVPSLAATYEAPYRIPQSYWIQNGSAPEGLPSELRGEVRCMAYVAGRLTERIGWGNLVAIGFNGEHHAWQLKRDLMKKNSVDVLASMQGYLSIGKGTIHHHRLNTPEYQTDLLQFRNQLEQSLSDSKTADTPHLLTLRYRHSDYAGKSARYNAGLKNPSERSLNTHILECLGKGKGPIKIAAKANEELTTYVKRSLNVDASKTYLLKSITLWANGKAYTHKDDAFRDDTGQKCILKENQKVLLEDIYFAHHMEGAQNDSFTALIASGKYDVVDILRIKPEKVKNMPRSREMPAVALMKHLYLKKGEDLKTAFNEQISKDPQDWKLAKEYWDQVGFDANQIRLEMEGIPIPDFIAMKNWVAKQGGFDALQKKKRQIQALYYEKTHPGEHLLPVESGKTPWQMIEPFFTEKLGKISKEERNELLIQLDRLNSSIDLRTFVYRDETGKTNTGYLKFELGSFVWINDELIQALTRKIVRDRITARILIPESMPVVRDKFLGPALEQVAISPEEKQLVEEVTDNPIYRTGLLLILLNEQKRSGGLINRSWVSDRNTVGLFQVSLDEKQMQKFGFKDMNAYKKALIEDPKLNAKVALENLKGARGSLDHYLTQNSEAVNERSQSYMAALCTLYNRPYRGVLNGLMKHQAQKVSDAFGLSLSAVDFEAQAREDKKVPEQLQGLNSAVDTQSTADYWEAIAKALTAQGVIELTEAQIKKDTALIVEQRDHFFQSETYSAIKEHYEAKTGQSLKLLLEGNEFKTTAILNYGYRVTRNGELAQIQKYSAQKNDLELQDPKNAILSSVLIPPNV
ncbi:hypothetical protein IPG41_01220 [Candidatus Peregrinibacteria bacterium]|nr:MAG: hypothetical protein IPG41_01220 [Candidatus Peregrinibacteria bacterium]